MANGIRIDDLDATLLPSRDHVVPAMKDGLTVKLTVGQILNLLEKVLDPDEVGSKALFAALNLSDLDDPEQARENLGATGIGHALFTAVSKAAGRAAIDALGPDETPDKAFRRGNILGTVSQDGGVPTGALIERGSNANGEYVRRADGMQICWTSSLTLPGGIDTAYGGMYRSDLVLWTYPAEFADDPVPSASERGNAQNWGAARRSTDNPSSVAEVYLFSALSRSGPRTIQATAIGRWF